MSNLSYTFATLTANQSLFSMLIHKKERHILVGGFRKKIWLPSLLHRHWLKWFNCFQGVAMPAMNNILSKWVPVAERSRSLALVYSGMYLGSVTGLAFSPFLIHQFGWPSVFFSFGSLGAVWFTVWLNKVTNSAIIEILFCQ